MSRFASPLVVKISFYSSSKANTAKNKAHIDYIATRPGVVKELEPAIDEMIDPNTAVGHIKYAHERPGSHGLFGPQEETNLEDIKHELGSHRGMVWRMIVSLKEEDACRLDMTSRRQWEQKMRAAIPDVADKMGIPFSNVKWCAAFHNEPGHPHVHVMIWEKEPKRVRGVLSKAERKDVRRAFAKEIYAEERIQLNREKTAERDLIRELLKRDIDEVISLRDDLANYRKEVTLDLKIAGQSSTGISPVAPTALAKELLNRLVDLAQQLPQKGRIALKYMPEEVKQAVAAHAEWLLSQPGVKIHVRNFLKAHEALTKMHVLNPSQIKQAEVRAYEDLKNRVAQILLRSSKQLQLKEDLREWENGKQASPVFAQTVFSQVFSSIQSEKEKAEAKSAWKQRKEGEKKKTKKRERG